MYDMAVIQNRGAITQQGISQQLIRNKELEQPQYRSGGSRGGSRELVPLVYCVVEAHGIQAKGRGDNGIFQSVFLKHMVNKVIDFIELHSYLLGDERNGILMKTAGCPPS
jgi:hypothetical protein